MSAPAPPALPPVFAFDVSEKGDATRAAPEAAQTGHGYRWTHIQRDTAEARTLLHSRSDLAEEICAALTAEDTRPRCTAVNGGAIIILRGVNLAPGQDAEDMVYVRLWLVEKAVFGVWLRPGAVMTELYREADGGHAPPSPGAFATELVVRLTHKMEPVVGALSDRIDLLEERALDNPAAGLRGELADIRRMAIVLRRYIAPQREAVAGLTSFDAPWLSANDRLRLREVIDRTTRLVEDLDALRERASVIHDQLADKRAEEMNRNMLVLAVVAAIFLPLGLLTGLLGINVGGIPLADSPFGFAAVTGGLLALGALQYWLYRRWNLL